ncbi:MAG: nif-specific transcriptional activator NifA [Candidatus Omnitrophica bacterium]|nr:nif-specific transcriptional activator NifA [Candidatus Omnitrophota bacterium]
MQEPNSQNLKRELLELTTLYEISQALNSSLNLEVTLQAILDILHKRMGMERGTVSLLDPQTEELTISVATGLDKKQMERGRYKVGEGITGKVVQAGEPIVVPNVGEEPLFLNRTKARGDVTRKNISFICVPVKLDKRTIGALSVDRLFGDSVSFTEDVRLLTIISSMVAQAVKIHEMVRAEKEALVAETRALRSELKKKYRPESVIGESKRMLEVYSSIELISQSKATVLLRGESGTGKELIAKAIHYASPRAEKPFIKLSCAALPETLLESELFGYEKGAFTGATTLKKGRFELANGGTLFLDEIGDVAPVIQVKLLRVLQEKEFERLGGTETIHVDVRIITATNKDLEREVREGKFREDLYYRLNVVPIFLPSLRERKEDLPILVNHFLKKFASENNKNIQTIDDAAWDHILNYPWPGNVRELENAIERAVILCTGKVIKREHFPFELQDRVRKVETPSEFEAKGNLNDAVANIEKKMIESAIKQSSGNKRKAAKMLGVTERILGYKLSKLKLENPGQ